MKSFQLPKLCISLLLGYFCLNTISVVAQNTREDSLIAKEYIKSAKAYSDSASYDTAIIFFEKASEIYKKQNDWENHIRTLNEIISVKRRQGLSEDLLDDAYRNLNLAKKHFRAKNNLHAYCNTIVGNILCDINKKDSAIYYFTKALKIYQMLSDTSNDKIANGLRNLGVAYSSMGIYDSALIYINKCLDILTKLHGKDSYELAGSHNGLGIINYHLGKLDDCEFHFKRRMELDELKYGKNHPITAEAYNNLASLYQVKPEFKKALQLHRNAYRIRKEKLPVNHPNIALSLNNIGNTFLNMGEYDSALIYHMMTLEFRKTIHDSTHINIAQSYTNLGCLYREFGDFSKSIFYYRKALPIIENTLGENNPYTANAYNNVGAAYASLGDFSKSLEFLKHALELRKRKGEYNGGVANSYLNIGALYKYQSNYDLALSYYNRSIEITKQLYSENHPGLSTTYNNIGEIWIIREKFDTAYRYFDKSFKLLLTIYDEDNPELIGTYLNLGVTYDGLKMWDEEYKIYQKGLRICLNNFGENHPSTARFLGNLAMNYAQRGLSDSAFILNNLYTHIVENIYHPKHPNMVFCYRNTGELYEEYELYDSAWSYYQKSLLANCATDNIYSTLKREVIFDEYEHILTLLKMCSVLKINYDLTKNNEYLEELLTYFHVIGKLTPSVIGSYTTGESKIDLLNKLSEYTELAMHAAYILYSEKKGLNSFEWVFRFSELNKSTALWQATRQCNAETNSEIPNEYLAKKSSILGRIYHLQTSITKNIKNDNHTKQPILQNKLDSLTIELQNINEAIHQFTDAQKNSYPESILLTDIDLKEKESLLGYFVTDSVLYRYLISDPGGFYLDKVPVSNLKELIQSYLSTLKKYDKKSYMDLNRQLYNILISGFEDKGLNQESKLNIIPDKYLFLLPFETLHIPGNNAESFNDFSDLNYLIKDFEISYHFSVLLWNKYSISDSNTKNNIVAFAPVFEDENNTVPEELDIMFAENLDEDVYRSISLDGKVYNDLPYTKAELDSIQNLVQKFNWNGEFFLSDDATEKNFINKTVGNKIVHIATHGMVDNQYPELCGLIFSQSSTRDSIELSSQSDGILYAKELYQLKLNADLVVLSACETGLGKLEKGEGILGLTRGFYYSGVPNIVYSYWKIGDKNTLTFMVHFYRSVLSGNSYSESLRQAKLKMIEDSTTSFPFIWGGYALIGR